MEQQNLEQLFSSFLEDCKKFPYDYQLTTDLDKWKKGVNEEYLMKKKVALIVESFGQESVNRIEKIVLSEVPDNLMYNLIPTTIKMWFLPYKHKTPKESDLSSYRLQVGKSIKIK